MTRRLWALALACALGACAYVDATTTQYVGVPRFPPTDPATVQVLPAEPMKVHDRLVEQRLREEAAKMGGNAVFVVRDMVNPNAGRKLIAVAIRYR